MPLWPVNDLSWGHKLILICCGNQISIAVCLCNGWGIKLEDAFRIFFIIFFYSHSGTVHVKWGFILTLWLESWVQMPAQSSLLWPEGRENSHPEKLETNKHMAMKKATATRSPNCFQEFQYGFCTCAYPSACKNQNECKYKVGRILWNVILESFTISERLHGMPNPAPQYHRDLGLIIKEKRKRQKWQRDSDGRHRAIHRVDEVSSWQSLSCTWFLWSHRVFVRVPNHALLCWHPGPALLCHMLWNNLPLA